MSASSETLMLIEQTSARLRQDIEADARPAHLQPNQPGTVHPSLRRAAWEPDGKLLSLHALSELVRGMPNGIGVDLSGIEPSCAFQPELSRVILNLLLLAAECLPSGGDVLLSGSADDLFLRIDGSGAAWPSGMGACLSDETAARAAMTAGGNVQMPLTALLAHAAGVRLSFLLSPGAASGPQIVRLGGR